MPYDLPGQVMPGRKNALSPYAVHGVEDVVQDLDARMRHADLVYIGEARAKRTFTSSTGFMTWLTSPPIYLAGLAMDSNKS
jgi:hypothetical protein